MRMMELSGWVSKTSLLDLTVLMSVELAIGMNWESEEDSSDIMM